MHVKLTVLCCKVQAKVVTLGNCMLSSAAKCYTYVVRGRKVQLVTSAGKLGRFAGNWQEGGS